jgi:hypothetical protein
MGEDEKNCWLSWLMVLFSIPLIMFIFGPSTIVQQRAIQVKIDSLSPTLLTCTAYSTIPAICGTTACYQGQANATHLPQDTPCQMTVPIFGFTPSAVFDTMSFMCPLQGTTPGYWTKTNPQTCFLALPWEIDHDRLNGAIAMTVIGSIFGFAFCVVFLCLLHRLRCCKCAHRNDLSRTIQISV